MQKLNLLDDPIPVLLRRMTVPISIGLVFTTLMNATDTLYASWYSVEAAAAVALSAPVVFFMTTAGIGIGRATNAIVGKRLGAGKRDVARHLALQALSLTFIASALTALVVSAFLPFVFGGLDSGPLYDLALAYVIPLLIATPLFCWPIVANAILNTRGMPNAYRNAQVGAFVANIFLDPLFMYGLDLGVHGIAYASVVTQAGAVVYLILKLAGVDFLSAARVAELVPDRGCFLELGRQALPTTTSLFVLAFSNVLIIWFIGGFGSNALAGYGIAWRIEQLCLLPLVGLMQAVIALTGVNNGAGNGERVREVIRHAYIMAQVLAVPTGVALLFASNVIMRAFTDVEDVMEIGSGYILILAFALPGYAAVYVSAAAMQGLGWPTRALVFNIIRTVLLTGMLSGAALWAFGTGIEGVWWALCLANWISALIMWADLRRRI
jgi:putative MATE family efflux protein